MANERVDAFRVYAYHDSDINLVSLDGRVFKLHQQVLASNDFFNSMFASAMMKEKKGILNLSENSNVLEAIFCFIYTGELSTVIDEDLINLYITARKYMVKDLDVLVAQRISKILNNSNAIEILILGGMSASSFLSEKALDYIVAHMKEVRHSDGWKLLSHELKDTIFDTYLLKCKKFHE